MLFSPRALLIPVPEALDVLLVLLLAAPLGCTRGPSSPEPAPAEPLDPAVQMPGPAATGVPTEARYAATHVLIAYKGAVRAPSTVTRSEAEAQKRAVDVWRRLAAGESIEELARRYSDGPSAPRGGAIGVYMPGTMMPEFEKAVAAVEVGAYTRPFHSPFGWHVARRDAVIEAEARHILVSWRGATRSRSTRTKEQARARIEDIQRRLVAGEDFGAVAREVGEDATAATGGELGVVAPGQLVPSFEVALFALEPGQRSAIVETPYGYHLIERTR